MAASPNHRDQKKRRRSKLWKGLLVGGAAIGIPAIANALISKRTRALGLPSWGRHQRYAWKYGEISFQTIGKGDEAELGELISFRDNQPPAKDAEERDQPKRRGWWNRFI